MSINRIEAISALDYLINEQNKKLLELQHEIDNRRILVVTAQRRITALRNRTTVTLDQVEESELTRILRRLKE